jgi:hypothetical protein
MDTQGEVSMFRKMTFILATAAALGAAALAPTSASAFGHVGGGHFGGPHLGGGYFGHGPHFVGGHYGHWGRGWGWGWGGVGVGLVGAGIVADGCLRREVYDTPYGPEVRWVNICY